MLVINHSIPTIFGPNLRCILAIVFLSATVVKATTNKAGTITIITSIIDINKYIFSSY